MSCFYFIAGKKKMPSLSVGIKYCRNQTIIIEDDRHILNIFDDSNNKYAKNLTDNNTIMAIEIGQDITTIIDDLLFYIHSVIKDNDNLEIWSTWNYEDEDIEKKTLSINDLTSDDIVWILGEKFYSHPKCLKIYKNQRYNTISNI